MNEQKNQSSITPEMLEDKFFEQIKLRGGKENSHAAEAMEVLSEAVKHAKPKAAFEEMKISEKGEDYVVINNVKIVNKTVREMVGESEKAVVYLMTLGEEYSFWAVNIIDILNQYFAEAAANCIFEEYTKNVNETIKKDYFGGREMKMISPDLNPAEWHEGAHKCIFDILGSEAAAFTGCAITNSGVLKPFKSISGFYC